MLKHNRLRRALLSVYDYDNTDVQKLVPKLNALEKEVPVLLWIKVLTTNDKSTFPLFFTNVSVHICHFKTIETRI